MIIATRARAVFAVLVATSCVAGCGPRSASELRVEGGGPVRTPLQTLAVQCVKVVDGQRSWLELTIEGPGREESLRMPVTFRRNGRPVDISEAHARALIDHWLKARASEIAIFGTIGMSFGQQSPAVTIEVEPRAGSTS